MTCIVGLVEGGTVWIGGDSAGVAGYSIATRADEKVFRNGPMLFGCSTSFRMCQLLRHALTVPQRHPDTDINKWMVTTFIDAVRECLKNHGWAEKKHEQEIGGFFLVGYEGRLFRIENDYQVGLLADGYTAIGCGDEYATGALFSTAHLEGRERVEMALAAAAHNSAGVRGPFTVHSL